MASFPIDPAILQGVMAWVQMMLGFAVSILTSLPETETPASPGMQPFLQTPETLNVMASSDVGDAGTSSITTVESWAGSNAAANRRIQTTGLNLPASLITGNDSFLQ
jgi:hypothetical protein